MRDRLVPFLGAAAAAVSVAWLLSVAAFAQTARPALTAWGAPDLQGVWDFRTLTPLERPRELGDRDVFTSDEAAARNENASTRNDLAPVEGDTGTYNAFWWERGSVLPDRRASLIVDPPDGRLPPLTPGARERATSPEARRLSEARRGRLPLASWDELDAGDRCIQHGKAGPPINPSGYNNNIQVFQTPTHVAILNEQIHDSRVVPLDGRPHLGPQIRQWMGDPRGRWEGKTLVIETTNFNGRHDQAARPLLTPGEHLTLVERFTRVDADTLHYEYTVTDPSTWERPWTALVPMKKSGDRLYEYACHEGNYSLFNMLAGARADEKAVREGRRPATR